MTPDEMKALIASVARDIVEHRWPHVDDEVFEELRQTHLDLAEKIVTEVLAALSAPHQEGMGDAEARIDLLADEVEYRVRTVAAHVAHKVRHGEPVPSPFIDREVQAGRARVVHIGRALSAQRQDHTNAEPQWACGKCDRESLLGQDDDQIPEHHRTCPRRAQRQDHTEPEWEYAMTTDMGGISDISTDRTVVRMAIDEWNERADRLRRESGWRTSYPGAYLLLRTAGKKPGPWGPVEGKSDE